MILYHGTQNLITQPIHPRGPLVTLDELKAKNKYRVPEIRIRYFDGMRAADMKLKNSADFGIGFYLTEDEEFACMRSCAGNGHESYLYEFDYEPGQLQDLNIFEFKSANIGWLLFVAYGRDILKENAAPELYKEILEFEQKWDIIAGPTANDRFYGMCKAFLSPSNKYLSLDHIMLLDILKRTNISAQYVLKTVAACDRVAIRKVTKASPEERAEYEGLVDQRATENTKLTDRLYDEAVEMRKTQPKVGLTFAEMLKEIRAQNISFEELCAQFIGSSYNTDSGQQQTKEGGKSICLNENTRNTNEH